MTDAKDKPKSKPGKVLFTADQISTRIGEIAKQINNDYSGAELHVVGVLENGFVFMADLVRRLEMPVICQFVRPEFKETVQGDTPTTEIFFGPDSEVKGQNVLLVEALIQSGVTSEFLIRNFLARGAASVKLAALLDKQTARRVSLQPDYFGFLLEETFVVGYGLGSPHVGRNLPYIGVSPA